MEPRDKAVLFIRIPLGIGLALAFAAGAGIVVDIMALLGRV